MFAVIFGKKGCPFCVRAKDVADSLAKSRADFKYRYIDIQEQGISQVDLEKTIGKPVNTVPQIFLDESHVGGFTEFEAHAKQNLGLYQ